MSKKRKKIGPKEKGLRLYIDPKEKYLFIEIRKNAATAMRQLLRDNGKYLDKKCPLLQNLSSIVIKKEDYTEDFNNYYSFCIIRNPIDRFISGFITIISAKQEWYKFHITEKNIKIIIDTNKRDWGKYIEISPNNISSAKEIVTKLILKMNLLGEDNNVHLLPQISHIPQLCSVSFYLLFDYLEEDCKRLAKKLGWKNEQILYRKKNVNPEITKEIREYIMNNKKLYDILLLYYKEDFELYNKLKKERK